MHTDNISGPASLRTKFFNSGKIHRHIESIKKIIHAHNMYYCALNSFHGSMNSVTAHRLDMTSQSFNNLSMHTQSDGSEWLVAHSVKGPLLTIICELVDPTTIIT